MGNVKSPFPGPLAASAEVAAAALAAFEAWYLTPASSPLDRFARGEEKALSTEERAGFDVFAGKGRCARCHVPPLFGGSYPSDFSTPIFAALGVPDSPAGKALDPDPGREGVSHRPRDRGAFKTPTVRDAAKTAPYFHNGAFPTLEAVVDFYDKGGGKGLGLEVPNQDPEVRPLKLTAAEKRALLRFLRHSLSDAGLAPGR
jgi:cytochrome c peroxidase